MNSSLSFVSSSVDTNDEIADILSQCDLEKRQDSRATAVLGGLSAFFVVCSLLLLIVAVHFNSPRPAMASVPRTSYLPWYSSFEEAQQQASFSQKLMLVDFTTDWCGVCKEMDASTFNDPAVIAEAQNVVPVKINAEVRTDLAQKYGINSYPTFVWMDAQGNERSRVSRGYNAGDFVALMQSNR